VEKGERTSLLVLGQGKRERSASKTQVSVPHGKEKEIFNTQNRQRGSLLLQKGGTARNLSSLEGKGEEKLTLNILGGEGNIFTGISPPSKKKTQAFPPPY